MERNPIRRTVSLILILVLVFTAALPGISAEENDGAAKQAVSVVLTEIDPGSLPSQKLEYREQKEEEEEKKEPEKTEPAMDNNEIVRVSIVMDMPSVYDAGYDISKSGTDDGLQAYREKLQAEQRKTVAEINKETGKPVDVVWQLSLLENVVSANVRYGDIEKIRAVAGVKDVVVEELFEANESGALAAGMPQGDMIGTIAAWAAGHYGAGTRIAIIDSGLDHSHEAFSAAAYENALRENAEKKGMSYDAYVASLDLLTAEKIDAVSDRLNAQVSGSDAYVNSKIGFNYNYIKKNLNTQNSVAGNHGTAVAGAAAANRYVEDSGSYVSNLKTNGMQGVAPDAQILVMRVLSDTNSAATSDFMAAIEDAIVLGCDVANLSIGIRSLTVFAGSYNSVMEKLAESDMVLTCCAGNDGMWLDTPKNASMTYSMLYADDVGYATSQAPSNYASTISVGNVQYNTKTGFAIISGDLHIIYTDAKIGCETLSTLRGGEYEYVMLDGPGIYDDADVGTSRDSFAQLGRTVLDGKVAVCYRGFSSFYAKANAAVAQGAVAVILVNNTDLVPGINLTDYSYDEPVVLITCEDGNELKAQSAAASRNGVTYYTGTLSIGEDYETQRVCDPYEVSMSPTSSYGTLGSLTLTPDIIAPGSSVLSARGGAGADESSYSYFSGTSYSSPITAGMLAVLAERVREEGLAEATGKTSRQLTTSLLMSSAHPVYDTYGNYWPVFAVGSGLANISDALRADTYIEMDEDSVLFPNTASGGQVKAELGDDPARGGEYSYSFTVTPFGEQKTFSLHTEMFTQALAGNAGYGLLQDTGTERMPAVCTYEVNGRAVGDYVSLSADVNRDGEQSAADADAVLSYITGGLQAAEIDVYAADVDGNGRVTSYDAKLILDNLEAETVTITGPSTVTVHITLDPEWTAAHEEAFTKGFYVEGYTYLTPEDGTGVVQSVPVYGYYGSWTDPAMFDHEGLNEEDYGCSYMGGSKVNTFTYTDEDGTQFRYNGNPYADEAPFPEDRLAFNPNNTINSFSYQLIRDAGTVGFCLMKNGTISYATANGKNVKAPYIHHGEWTYTDPLSYNVNVKPSAYGAENNTTFNIGLYAVPQYYAIKLAKDAGNTATAANLSVKNFKSLISNGRLGDGAGVVFNMTADTEAPSITDVTVFPEEGRVTVSVLDNQHVAYVSILSQDGSAVYGSAVPGETMAGAAGDVCIYLEEALPAGTYVAFAGDYAGNESACSFYLDDTMSASAAPAEAPAPNAAKTAPARGDGEIYAEIAGNSAIVRISEAVNAGNGFYTVYYDWGALTLTGCVCPAGHKAINVSNGELVFAYANEDDIPATDDVLTLTFEISGYVDTVVQVITKELNSAEPNTWQNYRVKNHTHSFGSPVWNWSEDLLSANVGLSCECGAAVSVQAEVTISEQPAQPHVAGALTYTAFAEYDGQQYVDTRTVATDALPCACSHFTDIPEYGTPVHAAVEWAYLNNVTAGISDTEFGTNHVVTRAQAVMFLWAAKGRPAPENTNIPFSDVKKTSWYYKAVCWAYENNITAGTTPTQFSPNKTCARAEILTFLYAAMGRPEVTIRNPYKDVKKSYWYYTPALWAYQAGIEKGDNGIFQGMKPCARGSIILYVYRAMTGLWLAGENGPDTVSEPVVTRTVSAPAKTVRDIEDNKLRVYGSILLEQDLKLIISFSTKNPSSYASYYVELCKYNQKGELIETACYGDGMERPLEDMDPGYKMITLRVPPQQMGLRYTARLICFDAEGNRYVGRLMSQNITDYLTKRLVQANWNRHVKAIVSDLLTYCSVAQTYYNERINDIITDSVLRPARLCIQKYRTKTDIVPEKANDADTDALTVDIFVGEGVQVNMKTAAPASSVVYRVRNRDTNEVAEYAAAMEDGRWTAASLFYDACTYRTEFEITAVIDGQDAETHVWSLEGELGDAIARNNIGYIELLQAMLKYSDSIDAANKAGIYSGD